MQPTRLRQLMLGLLLASTAPAGAQSVALQPQFGSTTPLIDSWARGVVAKIVSRQEYPRSAQIRGAEGRVRVRVKVAPDGTVISTEVIEASAFDVLNREAVRTVVRAAPYPAPPSGSNVFIVPLVWKMTN